MDSLVIDTQLENSHKHSVHEWTWLYAKKTLFTGIEIGVSYNFYVSQNILLNLFTLTI